MPCKTGVKPTCRQAAKWLGKTSLSGYSSMVEQQPSKLQIIPAKSITSLLNRVEKNPIKAMLPRLSVNGAGCG